MPPRYTTLEQVKTFGRFPDDSWGPQLLLVIAAAEAEIDSYCGRRFDRLTETRTLYIRTDNIIPCGDWVSVGTVVVEGVALTPGDYAARAYPTTDRPARDLRLIGHRAGRGETAVVTGTFGWPAVPPPIETAVVILAQKLFARSEHSTGLVAHHESGTVAVLPRQDPDVRRLLNPYRIPKLAAG